MDPQKIGSADEHTDAMKYPIDDEVAAGFIAHPCGAGRKVAAGDVRRDPCCEYGL
jgi:hypothetical protein